MAMFYIELDSKSSDNTEKFTYTEFIDGLTARAAVKAKLASLGLKRSQCKLRIWNAVETGRYTVLDKTEKCFIVRNGEQPIPAKEWE
jgi:hypothetical protein